MKTSQLVVVFVILTIKSLFAQEARLLATAPLNFKQLAQKYGFTAEEYDVVTEDGYILGLFRIPGNGKKTDRNRTYPILLMHGIADTSDTWLLRGETSLGYTLAKMGHDVWFGNVRGNKYSRRHVTLDPNTNSKFWDFSFNEHGYYDLKAMIDTILTKSGASKISGIGHSQGNTIFYVLGSTRPEYNEKINVITALAPVCYLTHVPPPLSVLVTFAPEINAVGEFAGIYELFGEVSVSGKLIDFICNNVLTGYPICALGVLFPLSGFDVKELGPKFYDLAIEHFPSSTSRKNLYHFSQVSRRKAFARYDYGAYKNRHVYNSSTPPNYDLNLVTMPVVLIAGINDKVSVLSDVETLRAELPNVKRYTVVDRKKMNHLDYVWGDHMEDYLFPLIFDALENNT